MKKFLFSAFVSVISSFLFVSFVKADITITIDPDYFSVLPSVISNIDTFKTNANNQASGYNKSMTVFYNPSGCATEGSACYFTFSYNSSSKLTKIEPTTGTSVYFRSLTETHVYCTYDNSLVLLSCATNSNRATYIYNLSFPLYSENGLNSVVGNDTTYVFTDGTNIYSVLNNATASVPVIFPSLDDLNTLWNTTPPDDTPLLTSFVDLVLEKLSLICEFFTSSYIYLSIFVVFILYFVILFFRRLK